MSLETYYCAADRVDLERNLGMEIMASSVPEATAKYCYLDGVVKFDGNLATIFIRTELGQEYDDVDVTDELPPNRLANLRGDNGDDDADEFEVCCPKCGHKFDPDNDCD